MKRNCEVKGADALRFRTMANAHARSRASRRGSVFSVSSMHQEVSRILSKTNEHKVIQYAKMMSVFIVPTATLFVISGVGLKSAVQISASSHNAQAMLLRDLTLAHLVDEIQNERSLTTTILDLDDVNAAQLERQKTVQYERVDAIIKGLHWSHVNVKKVTLRSKEDLAAILNDIRSSNHSDTLAILQMYSDVIQGLLRKISSDFYLQETGMIWRMVVAHAAIIQAIDNAGITRVLTTVHVRRCRLPTNGDRIWLVKARAKAQVLLRIAYSFHDASRAQIDAALAKRPHLRRHLADAAERTRADHDYARRCRDEMTERQREAETLAWIVQITAYMDILGETRRNVSDVILATIAEIVDESRRNLASYTVGAVLALVLSVLAGVWNAKGMLRITSTIGFYMNKLQQNSDRLNEERTKTDTLLHLMLPPSVAHQLKFGRKFEPREYEQGTVYFSDLLGFGDVTSVVTPMSAVQLLNNVYK